MLVLCKACGEYFSSVSATCTACGTPYVREKRKRPSKQQRVEQSSQDEKPLLTSPLTPNTYDMDDSMSNSEIILSRIHEKMRTLVQLNRKQHFWIRALGIVYIVIPILYGILSLLRGIH
jgi:ribosomal protein L37E